MVINNSDIGNIFTDRVYLMDGRAGLDLFRQTVTRLRHRRAQTTAKCTALKTSTHCDFLFYPNSKIIVPLTPWFRPGYGEHHTGNAPLDGFALLCCLGWSATIVTCNWFAHHPQYAFSYLQIAIVMVGEPTIRLSIIISCFADSEIYENANGIENCILFVE